MPYRWLADGLVVVHVLFVVFALVGALLVARWPRVAWLHLPAFAWAMVVEVNSWICPLTPWEQRLRTAAGSGEYAGGFVEHYVLPVLYPAGLTPRVQWALALAVLAVNVGLYGWLLRRRARQHRPRHVSGRVAARPR